MISRIFYLDIENIKFNYYTKNALDFTLCTYRGQMSIKYPKALHCIITRDKSFTAAMNYLNSLNISCITAWSINSVLATGNDSIMLKIKEVFPYKTNKQHNKLKQALLSDSLLSLNNTIQKNFNTSLVGDIYKKIKSIYIYISLHIDNQKNRTY